VHPSPVVELRRRSALLRSHADLRLVTIADGPATGGRLLEVRTPDGISADIALDRGGDILRLSWRGIEMGWHSAADAVTPWPSLDAEEGLGFLRGFDGFLVTCGLDHHGVATTTSASDFNYPLRKTNHHPLHGRIAATKAELLEKVIDWEQDEIRIKLVTRQATVFGEVLELLRTIRFSLTQPSVHIDDVVTNRGFRPTRHGILYHVNFGAPFLSEALSVNAPGWACADKPEKGEARPSDDHVEIVTSAPSPVSGQIKLINAELGFGCMLEFDQNALPDTAMWRAFQSGVFALGIEPYRGFKDLNQSTLAAGQSARYRLAISIDYAEHVK
jgi:Domain of unknown function (DUF4432)